MADKIDPAFHLTGLLLPINKILPMKTVVADERKNSAFRKILASIPHMGLIEPLIVYPRGTGKTLAYSLLDGHLRLEAFRKLGKDKVPCLIATEDEAYTYNHKVNVVPPIQQHFMIIKAIEHGVSEEKIAAALDVDVVSIRQKRDLLTGICSEAVELLKNKFAGRDALLVFRRVKPMRQIEMAELMVRSHNYTAAYAKCLLAATQDDQLVDPEKSKVPRGIRAEDVTGMEREMESLEQNFIALEETHGTNTLDLVLILRYLQRVTDNGAVSRFLSKNHPDILVEFQKLIANSSLDAAAG